MRSHRVTSNWPKLAWRQAPALRLSSDVEATRLVSQPRRVPLPASVCIETEIHFCENSERKQMTSRLKLWSSEVTPVHCSEYCDGDSRSKERRMALWLSARWGPRRSMCPAIKKDSLRLYAVCPTPQGPE